MMAAALAGEGFFAGALRAFTDAISRLDVRASLDILIIAVIIYYLLNLVRGTRAAQMAIAVVLLVLVFQTARWARLEMVEWLLTTLLPYFVIALIVLFQPEIRQALARAGRTPFWRRFSAHDPTESHADIVLAVRYFSQHKTGALIVLEREVGLKTYIESGIPLEARLSYDLLLSIFHHDSPLHDGAVIVQGERIAAAACFLPLSLNPGLSTQLGTRHRAAIGIGEESDAVAIVVSEQTGAVSLATGGTIEMNLSDEQLAAKLAELFASYRGAVALPAPPGGTRPVSARE
jgi:diadenylate cyclase